MNLRRLLPFAVVPVLLLGGCTALRQNESVRSAARSVLKARAFDDIGNGLRNEDAEGTTGALERYLRLEPDHGSLQDYAGTLNELAYPLADKGKTAEDFQRAETMARLAVELYDSAIKKKPSPLLRAVRANTRDSLAWALFRNGKLDEAERQQREALREMRAVNKIQPKLDVAAELPLHLGEILKGAGKKQEARAAFEEALTLEQGEPNAHARARAALVELGPAPVPTTPIRPKNTP